jgi:hypothetical protein
MTSSRLTAALFAGSLALAAAVPAHAIDPIYLDYKGIDGDVTGSLPPLPSQPMSASPNTQSAPWRNCYTGYCRRYIGWQGSNGAPQGPRLASPGAPSGPAPSAALKLKK